MFRQLEILSAEQHGHLRLKAVENYRFAADHSQAPIVFDEIVEAAKHFPIVFPAGAELRPVVLLGLHRGRNGFVDESGHWRAGYVPAWLRRYPFVFGRRGNDAQRLTVMLDRQAPHLDVTEGRPLFEAASAPGKEDQRPAMGAVLNDAVSFLSRYQEAADAVAAKLAPLAEYDTLVERNLEIQVGKQPARRISGMRVVERERVLALGDWTRSGLLEAIYAHWQSLTNFKRLTG